MAQISEGDDARRRNFPLVGARVVDIEGHEASIASLQQPEDGDDTQACVRLDDGSQLLVSVDMLALQDDGAYRLPFNFTQTAAQQPMQMRLPVIEEEVQLSKRTVDTGRGVRIHKKVAEQEKQLEQTLLREQLVVEHVPVGRVVDDANPPQTRYEGDTLVVPVLEEVLVVQKQLLLKEEVRITRQRHQEPTARTVRLRTEQVTVERFDDSQA